jgi:hypothetical protein
MSEIGIATLLQEFMSAMPPKADKPEPTRMTERRHGTKSLRSSPLRGGKSREAVAN